MPNIPPPRQTIDLSGVQAKREKSIKKNQYETTVFFIAGAAVLLFSVIVWKAVTSVVPGGKSLSPAVLMFGEPQIVSCTFQTGISYRFDDICYNLMPKVRNDSNKAIDQLIFYIRCKEPNRTVPHAEYMDIVSIPGGIEPGETKELLVQTPYYPFRKPNTDIPVHPLEIAIVDDYYPYDEGIYKIVGNIPMVKVDGNYVNGKLKTTPDPITEQFFSSDEGTSNGSIFRQKVPSRSFSAEENQ